MAIEDTLRANPGMMDTMRGYAHEQFARDAIGRQHVKRKELLARTDLNEEQVQEQLKEIEEALTKAVDNLERAYKEIIVCYRNERVLRAQMELVR